MTEETRDTVELTVQHRELQDLLSLPAWVQLCEEIQEQADTLQRRIIFEPVTDAGALYGIERMKGQLLGLLSLSATAQTRLESLEHSLAMANKED